MLRRFSLRSGQTLKVSTSLNQSSSSSLSKSPALYLQTFPLLKNAFETFEQTPTLESIVSIFSVLSKAPKHIYDFLITELNWEEFIDQLSKCICSLSIDQFIYWFCSENYSSIHLLYLITSYRPELFSRQNANKLKSYFISSLPDIYENAGISSEPRYLFPEKIQYVPTIIQRLDHSPASSVLFPLLQIIALFAKSNLISLDTLIITDFPPQHIDSFIDYYFEILPLFKEIPKPIQRLINSWVTQLPSPVITPCHSLTNSSDFSLFKFDEDETTTKGSQSPLTNSLSLISIHQIMRFLLMISYVYPSLVFTDGPFFPWNGKTEVDSEVLLYYYNYVLFSNTTSLAKRLNQYCEVMTKCPYELANALEFCQNKMIVALHKQFPDFNSFQMFINIINSSSDKMQSNLLSIILCCPQHLNYQEVQILCKLFHNDKYSLMLYDIFTKRLSMLQTNDLSQIFIENGLSFALRMKIDMIHPLEYLTFMLQLFVTHPLTEDFLVSEPRSFFSKIIPLSTHSKEIYDLIISFLTTGILSTESIEQFTSLLPNLNPPKGMSATNHRLNILKLYSLRNNELTGNELQYYYNYIKSSIELPIETNESLAILKEFYAVILTGFEAFKNKEEYKHDLQTFLLSETIIQKLLEVIKVIGNTVFSHLRNLSLDQLCVIDEPLFLEVFVKLLKQIEEIEEPFNELIPLLDNPTNVDTLSHSKLIEPLLVLASTGKTVNSVYYFLKRIISYNCLPSFLTTLLHTSHENGLREEYISLLTECTQISQQPRYTAEFSKQGTSSLSAQLKFDQTQVLSISLWAAIMNFPDYSRDSFITITSFILKDIKLNLGVSSTAITMQIITESHNGSIIIDHSFRPREFFNITVLLRLSKALDIQIAIDGAFISSAERIQINVPQSLFPLDLIIKPIDNARFRIGNFHFFKTILSEEMIKFIFTARADILPFNWISELPLNMKNLEIPTEYIGSLIVPSGKLYVHSNKNTYSVQTTNLRRFECIGMKEAFNAIGGIEVLLLFLSEVKRVEEAIGIIEVIRKYLTNNKVAALTYRSIHAGRILLEILSYTNYYSSALNESIKLTDSKMVVRELELLCCSNIHIETAELFRDIFFHTAFWMRTSGEVFYEYIQTIMKYINCPFKDTNLQILIEAHCIDEFISYVPVVVGLKMRDLQTLYISIIYQLLNSLSWKYITQLLNNVIAQYCINVIPSPVLPLYGDQEIINSSHISNLRSNSDTYISHSRTLNAQYFCLEVIETIVRASYDRFSSEDLFMYLKEVYQTVPLETLITLLSIAKSENLFLSLIKLLEGYLANSLVEVSTLQTNFLSIFESIRCKDVFTHLTSKSLKTLWNFAQPINCIKYVLMIGSIKTISIELVKTFIELILEKGVLLNQENSDLIWRLLLNITENEELDQKILFSLVPMIVDMICKIKMDGDGYCNELSKLCIHNPISPIRWALYQGISLKYNHSLFPSVAVIKIFQFLKEFNCSFFEPLPSILIEQLQNKILLTETIKTISLFKIIGTPLALYHCFLQLGTFSQIYFDCITDILDILNKTLSSLSQYPDHPLYSSLFQLVKNYKSSFTEDNYNKLQQSKGTIDSAIEWLFNSCDIPKPENIILPLKTSPLIRKKEPSKVIELCDSTDVIAAISWRRIVKKYTTHNAIFEYPFHAPYVFFKLDATLCNGNSQMIISQTIPKVSTLPVETEPQTALYKRYESLMERVKFRMFDEISVDFEANYVKWDRELPAIIHFENNAVIIRYHNGGEKNMLSRECKQINISFEDITSVQRLNVLYEDIGVEIYYFNSLLSIVLLFKTTTERNNFISKLPITPNELQRFNEAQRKWVKGELSNYEFLYEVNRYANRSFKLLSQYPIYPWVISTFSEDFRLNDLRSYRDLTLPISACNEKAKKMIESNYQEKECHFNCYLSSPSLVCRSLVRLQPYSELLWKEMSERCFEVGGRIFKSIEGFFKSSVEQSRSELIPQYYTTPAFLTNLNNYLTSLNGEPLGDVTLPNWAFKHNLLDSGNLKDRGEMTSPREFIRKMKMALESSNVSKYLNTWIDLIFGCLQQSVNHYNVYLNDYTINSTQPDSLKQTIWKTMGHLPLCIMTKECPEKTDNGTRFSCNLGLNCAARRPKKVGSVKEDWCSLVDSKNGYTPITIKGTIGIGENAVYYDEVLHQIILLKPSEIFVAAAIGIQCVNGDDDWIVAGGDNVLAFHHNHSYSFNGISNISSLSIKIKYDSIIAGNENGMVIVWSITKQRIRWKKQFELPVQHVLITNNGDIFILTYDHFENTTTIIGCDINGIVFGESSFNARVTAITCSQSVNSTSPTLAVGTSVGEVLLYDAFTLALLFSYSADRKTKSVTSFLYTNKDCKLYYSTQREEGGCFIYSL
ncbi:beige/beach domain containing protein [Entamoeba histolytica KU27]|uniref:Beige/beach domain containing protein n=1 Tax=Entamoeba histolytica KU27 TaxID=885311 RepID=M2RV06_ENTHI|nr:beige/beach domain containing protein [Entamoeba histolytica KU27]